MTSWQMGALAATVYVAGRPGYATSTGGRYLLARPKWRGRPPQHVTRDWTVGGREVGGFPVHTVTRPDGSAEPGSVVFLHGGAYVNEIALQHWSFVTYLAGATRRTVHVPIYGLAPRHHALEALTFVQAVAAGLPAGEPVHLVGDSSGGGLGLLLAQHWPGDAPRLAGLTLISPWLDLTLTNPGIAEVERHDPWLARPGLQVVAEAWTRELSPADPRVSPLRGRLDGLPPVDLHVGTREITLPDCRVLRDRLAPERIRYHEEPGGLHIYPLLPVPEGLAARESIAAFARDALDTAPPH